MSGDVFVLGGGKLEGTRELDLFLKGNGIQPSWKGVIFGLGLGNEWKPGSMDHATWFSWPGVLQLDAFTLHAAVLEVDAGNVDWVLLLQAEDRDAFALLMVSPAALGRGNMLPVAGIHSAIGEDLEACLATLHTDGIENDPVVVSDSSGYLAKGMFPQAQVVSKVIPTIPGQVMEILNGLPTEKGGMLVNVRPGATITIWLEGI